MTRDSFEKDWTTKRVHTDDADLMRSGPAYGVPYWLVWVVVAVAVAVVVLL
jgi:hypothetical protein